MKISAARLWSAEAAIFGFNLRKSGFICGLKFFDGGFAAAMIKSSRAQSGRMAW
jgi:hypothetical protein